jgi:deoxyribonuclease V
MNFSIREMERCRLPEVAFYPYNQSMQIVRMHKWNVSTLEARGIQEKLASRVSRECRLKEPRLVAGVDISVNRFSKTGRGAVVVLSYPTLEIMEISTVTDSVTFPYVPGLLTFREAPLLLAAFEKLKNIPDLILVDGQGIAHPRRIGLASHLGVVLNIPTIGCAKSRLCGEHDMPGMKAGSYTELEDRGEVIGAVLRTRDGVKPVYVSIGHMVDLPSAVRWVGACCRGYRLPEPTRLAHQAAGGNLKEVKILTAAPKH